MSIRDVPLMQYIEYATNYIRVWLTSVSREDPFPSSHALRARSQNSAMSMRACTIPSALSDCFISAVPDLVAAFKAAKDLRSNL